MVKVVEKECVLSDSELTAAIEMLRAIIPDEELELLAPTGPATVYTTSITSVDMMKKALLTSVVAYNLVIQFRRGGRSREAGSASSELQRGVVHISKFPSEPATVFVVRMADPLRRCSSNRSERQTSKPPRTKLQTQGSSTTTKIY